VATSWLTLREAAQWSERSLTAIVNALVAGDLPYLRTGDDPFEWFIEQGELHRWTSGEQELRGR